MSGAQHQELPTPGEVHELVQDVLQTTREFLAKLRAAVIAPDLFLQIPAELERIDNLAEAYDGLSDLLPLQQFEQTLNEILECHEQLIAAENIEFRDLPPLFVTQDIEIGPYGYPRFAISEDFVRTLIDEAGLTNAEIANLLGCSLRTLERRLNEWGLSRRDYNISDQDLFNLVRHLKSNVGVFYGERAISGILRGMNVRAPRSKLREILREVDPDGISLRWRQAVYRRKYTVPFVNSLWHIDGNHKLRRWKLVVHGGIDGKSRAVVFLRVSDNNTSATVGNYFVEATQEWGWPSRVRADWGGENVWVKRLMEYVRGLGRGSFFAGPSTHNQRIERLWRDVFTWTLRAFYALFTVMEELGILDPSDDLQLWALHLVFIPRINCALAAFVSTWNNHKLSTEGNKSPHQLFIRGMIEARQKGFHLNPGPQAHLDDEEELVRMHYPDFTLYGSDFRGAQRARRPDDPEVVVEPPQQYFLSDEDVVWIREDLSSIPEADDFYGTQKYLRVLELIDIICRTRFYN